MGHLHPHSLGQRGIPYRDVLSAARVHKTNRDAAGCLGISANYFSTLCRKYCIDTPAQRRRKERERNAARYRHQSNDFANPNP